MSSRVKWGLALAFVASLLLGASVAMRTSLWMDHATAVLTPGAGPLGQSLVTFRGPAGYTVVTYDVVLNFEGRPVVEAAGYAAPFTLLDVEAETSTNYFPSSMPPTDIPLETHVRLFGEASPAATVSLPQTPDQVARVGHWVVVTRDRSLVDRLDREAPALQP